MNEYREPWKMATSGRIELAGKVKVTKRMVLRSKVRAVACVNALAGLEPGDVATLVGLVRRYYAAHNDGACACPMCAGAGPLLARLP